MGPVNYEGLIDASASRLDSNSFSFFLNFNSTWQTGNTQLHPVTHTHTCMCVHTQVYICTCTQKFMYDCLYIYE